MAREVISGVGKMARRTDMNLSQRTTQPTRYIAGGAYGEGQEMMDLQASAPMQGAPVNLPKVSNVPTVPVLPKERSVPLTAPTQRLDEAPETGMPFGAGPGPEILVGQNPQSRKLSEQIAPAIQFDPSGETQAFYDFLVERGY